MFQNKVILAPMVRVCTLPMRLLALDYGADLVYCEEIIDHKMLKCRRIVNHTLGTIDYIDDTEDVVVFRTCSKEKDHIVFQIGTCNPQRALKVAKLVENDVAAIDINMGCPKEFSIKGGMGAALLSQPEKIKAILTTLVEGISKPVTCKIRILPRLEDSIVLCKLIEGTGVSALAIHGRMKDERPCHPNHDDIIKAITKEISIPVIANGGSREMTAYKDLIAFKEATNASSVMIARAAMWNCSIFRKTGVLSLDDAIVDYLKYAVTYDNHPLNSKYCVQQMLQDLQETDRGRALLSSKTLLDICKQWHLEDYFSAMQTEFNNRAKKLSLHKRDDDDMDCNLKRIKVDGIIQMTLEYVRSSFKDCELPKTRLYTWCRKEKLPNPVYEMEYKEKLFKSVVTVNGKKYTTSKWEKNKKSAEQAAALVGLHEIGIIEESSLQNQDSIVRRARRITSTAQTNPYSQY